MSAAVSPPAEEGASEALDAGLPWLVVAAVSAVVMQVLDGADGLAIAGGAAAAATTFGAVVASRRAWVSRRLVLAGLLAAAVLLVPAGRGGAELPLILLTATVQLAAALVSSRHAAFAVALGAAAGAAVGSALRVATDAWPVGVVTLALGAAIVQIVTAALEAAEAGARRPEAPAPEMMSLAGPTRLELDRLKREIDIMTSQLRREASSRQSAEARLLEAFRAKETFLATMSHELRTPLSQIIGYSELLIEEAQDGDSAELTGEVSRIHQAAMNLFDIIGNALDQSQINSGKVTADPEPVDLFTFVEHLVQSFATQARARSNTLRLRCAEDIGVIVTDRTKLHTILKNLLGNACKFTEGGTIRLSVELDTATATPTYVFAVRDTGIGIRPEDMARLFRPFEQVDGSRTRRYDGAGLGLAVSRHLAAILGGELIAQSTPGDGSTFTLRLPKEWPDMKGAGVIVRSLGF